jgi:hypothetical protein
MTDTQTIRSLKRALTKSSLPVDSTGTITAAVGSEVQTNMVLGGSNNWQGGVLEITSGNAIRSRGIIASNNNSTITLASPFDPELTPAIGDTVRLTGGPLKSARLFEREPSTVEKDIKDGITFFVVIDAPDGEEDVKALPGRQTMAIGATFHDYTIEIACETPDIGGIATEADVNRIVQDLPTLKDQVLMLANGWRVDKGTHVDGMEPIEWVMLTYQRTGSTRRMRGAILQFNITMK